MVIMNEESVKRRLEMLLVDLEVVMKEKGDKEEFKKLKNSFLRVYNCYHDPINGFDLSKYQEMANKILKE